MENRLRSIILKIPLTFRFAILFLIIFIPVSLLITLPISLELKEIDSRAFEWCMVILVHPAPFIVELLKNLGEHLNISML